MRFKLFLGLIAGLLLSGCSSFLDYEVVYEQVPPEKFPVITSVGYAPISSQVGKSESEKVLNAMKASKIQAYRELAEIIYGQHVKSSSEMSGMTMGQERVEVKIDAIVQGARVIRSYPTGDIYATELSLDTRQLYDMLNSMQTERRVKDVNYFWR